MLREILVLIIVVNLNVTESVQNFDLCSSINVTDKDRIVKTLDGQIKGDCYEVPVTYSDNKTVNYNVFSWRGIPFAEVPTGSKRFMKPVPVTNWIDIKQTTEWPSGCPQYPLPPFSLPIISEDCLYLNIFSRNDTYLNRANELKPMMIWIHGGSLLSDSSASDIWEPSTLVAAGDVIVASINYRLGIFGFLHLSDTKATGNIGLLDQQLAIKWIYDNAEKFGGDKKKITIFGESAGSFSVGFHLFMEPSWPYFRNAIMESGAPGGSNSAFRLISSSVATNKASKAISKLCNQKRNSDKLLCLQNATLNELYTVNIGINTVVLDNIVFKSTIFDLTDQRKYKKCNIITGSNSAETGLFLMIKGFNSLDNQSQFIDEMKAYGINDMVNYTDKYRESIYLEYFNSTVVPNSTSIDYTRKYVEITSDQIFNCQKFSLAEAYSKIGKNAYVYMDDFIPDSSNFPTYGGLLHGEEISQVFGEALSNKKKPLINEQPLINETYSRSFNDKNFAEKIITYWTNFAIYDDPNYSYKLTSIKRWEPFVKTSFDLNKMTAVQKMNTGRYILFSNQEIKMMTGFSEHKCNFWNYTLNRSAKNYSINVLVVLVLNVLVISRI